MKLPPKLHVMLDTNALFMPKESDKFFSPRTVKVIQDPAHAKLNIAWIIPQMVQAEREYHIRQGVKPIQTGASNMPSLFNGTWIGSESEVHDRITKLATDELARLGVESRPCDHKKVDWQPLMQRAGLRLPPFDPNPDKEKGFKDAIVAETFLQLCRELKENSDETAILVTDDKMLRENVLSRTKYPAVKVLVDIDALRNELNFLVSDIPPEMQGKLQSKAFDLIGNNANPDFWHAVWNAVNERFGVALVAAPPGIASIVYTSSNYYTPVFVEKKHRRVSFTCTYEILRKAKRWVWDNVATQSPINPLINIVNSPASPTAPSAPSVQQPPIFGSTAEDLGYSPGLFGLGPNGRFEEIDYPSATFTVSWSASYDVQEGTPDDGQSIVLTEPRFESVDALSV